MKVTIRTIAERAGVSVPTVSRVLNSPHLVNPRTRERVLEIVRLLNYFPDEHARNLRGTRSRAIGVIVPGIANFFFSKLYAGISRAASESGLRVVLNDSSTDPESLAECFYILKRQQVDGIVYCSAPLPEGYSTILSRVGVPVALALTESPDNTLPAFKVDDVKASFDAVAYLVSRGHQKIAMISGSRGDVIAGTSRQSGYRQAMHHYRLSVDEDLVAYGDFRFEHGYEAMVKLLSRRGSSPFTAVFVASDEMAVGAIRCAYEHGLRVPDDLSVVGFDNIPLAGMVTPKLTTVSQPFEEIGAAAVRWLIKSLGKGVPAGESHYLAHELIVRESVLSLSGNPTAYDTS